MYLNYSVLMLLLSFKFSLVAQSGREYFDLRSQASSGWCGITSLITWCWLLCIRRSNSFLPHYLQRKTAGFPEGRAFVGGEGISKENFEGLVSLEKCVFIYSQKVHCFNDFFFS